LPSITPIPVAPVSTGIGVPKPRIPKWVTIAAGGVVVVAVGVGIAVVASGGGDSTTLGGSNVTVDATDANGNTVTAPGGADTTGGAGGGAGGSEFDLTPVVGTWVQPCQPYLDGSGASQGSMTVAASAPNEVTVVVDGGTAKSADCAGGFTSEISVTYVLSVTAAGTSAGVQGFVTESAADPTCESVEPTACSFALSGVNGQVPTAIGVDGSGQLMISTEAVTGGALPTTWQPMAEGSTRA
jgi:hypothetical protein